MMSDSFDPSEFDDPALSSSTEPDYRTLLDAMSQAGSNGVLAALEPFTQTMTDLKNRIEQMEQAERALRAANDTMFWVQVKHTLLMAVVVALVSAGVGLGIGMGYHWFVKEPEIIHVHHHLGCSAAWDAKARKCKGEWVPLNTDGKVKP